MGAWPNYISRGKCDCAKIAEDGTQNSGPTQPYASTASTSLTDLSQEKLKGGHPDFFKMTIEELEHHSRKNSDYAKGGNPLGNFYRVSSWLKNYPGLDLSNAAVVALVYAAKQLDAAMWMLSEGYDGKVEGIQERLKDVHVYMKIARILQKEINECK